MGEEGVAEGGEGAGFAFCSGHPLEETERRYSKAILHIARRSNDFQRFEPVGRKPACRPHRGARGRYQKPPGHFTRDQRGAALHPTLTLSDAVVASIAPSTSCPSATSTWIQRAGRHCAPMSTA